MENFVFWDITPCSHAACFMLVSCLSYSYRPWRWRRHVPPKRRLTFNGLRGVISQKVELAWTYNILWTWKNRLPIGLRLNCQNKQ
jgi:nitrate reductase gamma subunit